MRKLAMKVMAISLLLCTARYGSAELAPDPAVDQTSKLEESKAVEAKGDLARAHENYGLATAYYFAALHISPRDARLYNKLGLTELQMHDRGQARKYFKLALKYDPHQVYATNNLGVVLLLDKKYKASIGYFKQVLAMDESNASTHLNLAEAWMGLGEGDRAMTEYARALELDADILSKTLAGVQAQVSTPAQRARIAFMIAKAYMKRGNTEGALEYLQRAKDGHYEGLSKVYTDSDFMPLWQDPRLAKIVKR
jgi:tetratricopeptide (TPR) repeat protein